MGLFMMVVTAVAYLINSRLGAVLLLCAAVYYLFVKKGSVYEKLLNLIVYSVPYYSFSIFGGRQRLSVCIVAAMVLCVLLTVRALRKRTKFNVGTTWKLFLFLVFFAGYCMSMQWGSHAQREAVLATYQLVVLAYLTFIISISKNDALKDIDTEALMKLLIQGVCALAITLYIQYLLHTLFGTRLGEIYRYRSGRSIYNIYFYAKSVLSLYISVGMLYYFISFMNQKRLTDLVWLALLVGTFWMNNSRTGLGCFAICAAIYCLRNFKQTFKSVKVIAMLFLVVVVGLYTVQFMMESRTSLEGIADDNGRVEQIIAALEALPNYIFSGIGGSEQDVRMSSVGFAIHNFFMAYLIQFGVFGGLAVNSLLIAPVFSFKNPYWYYLLCVVVGGMFFANWQNAVYIIPIYILFLLIDNRHSGGMENATS